MTPDEPIVPDGEARREAAGERAKAAARDSAHWLREEAGRLYAGYQKQSKYFKWRSWIVATWVVITLTSVALATRSSWTNQIQANVVVTPDSIRGQDIYVENESPQGWSHVEVILDGRWHFTQASLPAHGNLTKNSTEFVNRKGERAPATFRPRVVRVKTDQGDFDRSLEGE